MAGAALPLEFLDKVSVFETFRAYAGRFFLFDQHLERLCESLKGLAQGLPVSQTELGRWVKAAFKESAYADAFFRLSVHWQSHEEGVLVLIIREFKGHPAPWYEKGVTLTTSVVRRPFLKAQESQVKASQYVGGVLAMLDEGGGRGAPTHELLFLGPQGTVAEGTVSNIFAVCPTLSKARSSDFRKGVVNLLTPPASSGILRGVTRGFVMTLAKKAGMDVEETPLTRHDLYNAAECFMTNTSSEILPVVCVDERKIGEGVPGPVTQKLAKEFKKYAKN